MKKLGLILFSVMFLSLSNTYAASCVLATVAQEDFAFVDSVLKHDHRTTLSIVTLKDKTDADIAIYISYSAFGMTEPAKRLAAVLEGTSSNKDSILYGKAKKIIAVDDCRANLKSLTERNIYKLY